VKVPTFSSSACVSQVPEKTLDFVRVEIVVYGRGRNRDAGVVDSCEKSREFFYLRKRVAGWRSETDVNVSSVSSDKSVYDAREWTHHDHTASELPDNIRNVSGI